VRPRCGRWRGADNGDGVLRASDDDVVDPDAAVQVLEDVGGELPTALRREGGVEGALAQMKASEQLNEARPEVIEFLESFLYTTGLEEGPGEDAVS
jgi:hypothetical protein